MTPTRRGRSTRSRRTASSLTEALVFAAVLGLLMTGVLALVSFAATTGTKTMTMDDLGDDARLAVDEVVYQVRSGDLILPSRTLGTLSYQTNGSSIVLRTPGYDPATTAVFTGNSDFVALRFDQNTRMLTQTIQKSTGSARPTRTEKVLARNVASTIFTYRVRDQFTPTESGLHTLTLSRVPLSAPKVFINGVPAASTFSGMAQSVTVTTPYRGSDVQVTYAVSPTANSGAALNSVTEVDVTIRLTDRDQRNIERVQTLQGGARLRNRRL
ncbi:MAG TPA: hypothetical protein VM490_08610 [Armatimonadaceae bacterium]|jgi:hypothetical protein|nr:hypothetical protein [Armatimonadaceae bacterium]